MNCGRFLLSFLLVLLLTACSTTKTATVLADKWNIGQHLTCLYGHNNLYCLPNGYWSNARTAALRSSLSKSNGTLTTPEDPPPSLIESLVTLQDTAYRFERLRSAAEKNKDVDSASYETKFISHTLKDFSIWDCYKTGLGSPAVSCSLKETPTTKQAAEFSSLENKQQMLYAHAGDVEEYLRQLRPEKVIATCGQVTEFKETDFPDFGAFLKAQYKDRPNVQTPGIMWRSSIGTEIDYRNSTSQHAAEVEFKWSYKGEIERVNGWYESQSTWEQAADAVADVPCILKNIQGLGDLKGLVRR